MHKSRTVLRRGALVASLVCAALLAGCSGMPNLPFDNPLASLFETTSVRDARIARLNEHQPALSAPDLVSEGVLTVGLQTSAITAPQCIVSGDVASGMDIDLASAIADEMGLMVRFVSVDAPAQALANGECDVVMDVSADRSGAGLTVVGTYYESAAAFFHKGEPGVVTVDALGGATVGLQQGSVSQGVLGRTGLVMTERTYANLNEAFDALAAGSVDYVLCDAYPGAYLASTFQGIGFAGTLNAPSSFGIAALPEKETTQVAVKQALDTVTANGVYDIIRSRWVGGMPAITVADEIRDVPGIVDGQPEGSDAVETMEGMQNGSDAGSNAVTSV